MVNTFLKLDIRYSFTHYVCQFKIFFNHLEIWNSLAPAILNWELLVLILKSVYYNHEEGGLNRMAFPVFLCLFFDPFQWIFGTKITSCEK